MFNLQIPRNDHRDDAKLGTKPPLEGEALRLVWTLSAACQHLNGRDADFARSLQVHLHRKGSLTPKQLPWVDVLIQKAINNAHAIALPSPLTDQEDVRSKQLAALNAAARWLMDPDQALAWSLFQMVQAGRALSPKQTAVARILIRKSREMLSLNPVLLRKGDQVSNLTLPAGS